MTPAAVVAAGALVGALPAADLRSRALLVLDLRVPSHQAGTLLASLLKEWPAYIAFLASFSYIAVVWTNQSSGLRAGG